MPRQGEKGNKCAKLPHARQLVYFTSNQALNLLLTVKGRERQLSGLSCPRGPNVPSLQGPKACFLAVCSESQFSLGPALHHSEQAEGELLTKAKAPKPKREQRQERPQACSPSGGDTNRSHTQTTSSFCDGCPACDPRHFNLPAAQGVSEPLRVVETCDLWTKAECAR